MAIMKGVTSNGVEVQLRSSKSGNLEIRSNVQSELEHSSGLGQSFAFRSADTDIDAGDTRLFVKNTGDQFFVLSRAEFGPANVVCKWDVGIGAEITTPTGTVVTAVNMNEGFSTTVPSYIAFDDETAVADATPMMTITTNTTESRNVDLSGIILGKNHYIQINQETESTSGQVTIFGHFDSELT
jgi:hypothetical protein